MGALDASAEEVRQERELVERHRYGDSAAFEAVYEAHATMVYNLTYRMCGDAERARDWSQEVFLRVHKSLARFRGRSSLKTWIYRICLNHCRSRLARRRIQTESLTGPLGIDDEIVDPRRSPEARAVASDAGRQVAQALAQVDRVFREAVILRDIEGLTYDEIAKVLRVRPGTVRSRIARGREQLRRALSREPERLEEAQSSESEP